MDMYFRAGSVEIKAPREIDLMREVCRLAADTLCKVGEIIRPGLTTDEINDFVNADTARKGARPAPLNYRGFPKSVCTSINEVVCHGIPSGRALKAGDIINVDVTHLHKGYHGDTSATFYVGTPSEDARRVVEVASVVRDFVGHGIGRKFHDEPKVNHYGQWGKGIRLKPGMTFTIEPMINLGSWEVQILDDDWTAVTADGSLSAQFEHTILVTPEGAEVLTARSMPLQNSEIFPDFFQD
jgi:methionyl aminopeptidase